MKYNTNQVDSSISTLKSQVTDVKNVMTQNIDKILESEDRLSIFTGRTDDPQTTVSVPQLSWYPNSALSHRIPALEANCPQQKHSGTLGEMILYHQTVSLSKIIAVQLK